jgi:hypothetical protein
LNHWPLDTPLREEHLKSPSVWRQKKGVNGLSADRAFP